MPTFGSLFTGIGGFDLGLERAGWRCLWQCEIDPYRRGVLERWWPGVDRHEDVRNLDAGSDEAGRLPKSRGNAVAQIERGLAAVDLICGGFPCQDLSVAGRRAGLKGERSGLFFEFARILDAVQPRWCLIENVPGLLSSNGGRDFAVVLSTLADLGYGVAWRVLDSRYFGVPQRRRRVFIVGHLGARSADPFLSFLEGGGGDPAESRTTGQDIAGTLGSLASGGFRTTDLDGQGAFIVSSNMAGRRREDDENLVPTAIEAIGRKMSGGPEVGKGYRDDGTMYTLDRESKHGVHVAAGVRRLTPIECCRLQGFPDDWLGGNEPPDSPKYAALGDAVTVPVAEWIGRRLMEAM